jgi:hypothetical protein
MPADITKIKPLYQFLLEQKLFPQGFGNQVVLAKILY